jgi:hypothetical protein
MRALEIPFVVRYGSKNGAKYKGCIFAAIILAVIIYMLFGYIPRFMSAEHFFEWYENMMNSTTNGMLIFIAVLPYISLTLYCISYRISCRLYQKGVDTYDK